MTCAEVAVALPAILDGGFGCRRGGRRPRRRVMRCQCELAKYRKMLRLLDQLRAVRVEPPAGTVSDVFGALEQAAQRHAIRSALGWAPASSAPGHSRGPLPWWR